MTIRSLSVLILVIFVRSFIFLTCGGYIYLYWMVITYIVFFSFGFVPRKSVLGLAKSVQVLNIFMRSSKDTLCNRIFMRFNGIYRETRVNVIIWSINRAHKCDVYHFISCFWIFHIVRGILRISFYFFWYWNRHLMDGNLMWQCFLLNKMGLMEEFRGTPRKQKDYSKHIFADLNGN